MDDHLPNGWVRTTLGEVCAINPRAPIHENPSDHAEVSFVPMAAVQEETGRLDASQVRTLASVRKGYTRFEENDVIFAKITPCMENGKIALATDLKNGIGYGSTEFFVFSTLRRSLAQIYSSFSAPAIVSGKRRKANDRGSRSKTCSRKLPFRPRAFAASHSGTRANSGQAGCCLIASRAR